MRRTVAGASCDQSKGQEEHRGSKRVFGFQDQSAVPMADNSQDSGVIVLGYHSSDDVVGGVGLYHDLLSGVEVE